MKKIVLFHRDFQRFSGGHLKVWNYFNHVRESNQFEPRIAFTRDSKWDETNPWREARDFVVDWKPESADVLFLAGTDWRVLQDRQALEKPIINLLQHPRHADAKNETRKYLRHRAARICVSQQVADAINATGEVNGPVFVIPNGIDLSRLPKLDGLKPSSLQTRKIDMLISGFKAPDFAREIAQRLPEAKLVVDPLPRNEYVDLLRSAKITLFVPRETEGFYLPALEGMAAGTLVVCPDCFGNRSFCLDGVNCFRPEYNLDAIIAAANHATKIDSQPLLERAAQTAREHSLENEREKFLSILHKIDTLL
jgi:glycosyltransferase involved in cell wall biosynthesis